MINHEKLSDPNYQLWTGINRAARYHHRRQMFYERWNAITAALSGILLASGSVVHYYEVTTGVVFWTVLLALGAAWCVVDASLGTNKKANLHSNLAHRFIQLEKTFAVDRDLSDEERESAIRERLEIESNEPPTIYLLNELCQYEVERSVGVKGEAMKRLAKIPNWRKSLAPLFSQQNFTVGLADK